MSSVLPRFITKHFHYTPIGSNAAAIEGNTTKIKFHMGQILLSKSARAVAVLLMIVLLLTVTAVWLPTDFSSKNFLPPSAQNCNCTSDRVDHTVDWSRYAYVQYATNDAYLCNSVMLFEILHRLGSNADRLLMYPSDFQIEEDPNTESFNGRLLKKARDKYKVKLKAIEVQKRSGGDGKFRTTTG